MYIHREVDSQMKARTDEHSHGYNWEEQTPKQKRATASDRSGFSSHGVQLDPLASQSVVTLGLLLKTVHTIDACARFFQLGCVLRIVQLQQHDLSIGDWHFEHVEPEIVCILHGAVDISEALNKEETVKIVVPMPYQHEGMKNKRLVLHFLSALPLSSRRRTRCN